MARRIDALRLDTLTTATTSPHWAEVLLASTHHPEADGEADKQRAFDARRARGRRPGGSPVASVMTYGIPYCRQRADLIAASSEEMPHLGRVAV